MPQVGGYGYDSASASTAVHLQSVIDNGPRRCYALIRGPFCVRSGLGGGCLQLERSRNLYDTILNLSILTHAVRAVIPTGYGSLLGKPQYDWGFLSVRALCSILRPSDLWQGTPSEY